MPIKINQIKKNINIVGLFVCVCVCVCVCVVLWVEPSARQQLYHLSYAPNTILFILFLGQSHNILSGLVWSPTQDPPDSA
jgi:hypothetical protein